MHIKHLNKILVVGHSTSPFAPAIVRGFKSLGFNTYFFDHFSPTIRSKILGIIINRRLSPHTYFKNKLGENINNVLIQKAFQLHPDLIFLFKAKNILPGTIKTIKKRNIPIANWFPDYYDDWNWISKHADLYDYFFTPCYYVQKKLKQIGISSIYIPFATDADQKIIEYTKQYNVSFVGRFTQRRNILFRELFKANILDVWGYSHWQKSVYAKIYHGQVDSETCKSIIRKSRITVNTLTATDEVPIQSINYRVFEATGVGGFVLTWYNYPLEEAFKLNKEIVVFKTPAEALEKAQFYLSHPKLREKVARAGWERTNQDHTYETRLKQLVAYIT